MRASPRVLYTVLSAITASASVWTHKRTIQNEKTIAELQMQVDFLRAYRTHKSVPAGSSPQKGEVPNAEEYEPHPPRPK